VTMIGAWISAARNGAKPSAYMPPTSAEQLA
jgi:hypothetical protein